MKNRIFKLMTIAMLVAAPTVFALAQPNPGENSGGGGVSGGPIGGTAPIGSGLVMLLGLGMAYGAKKVYDLRKTEAQ